MKISEKEIESEVSRIHEIAYPLIPGFISNLSSLAAVFGYSSFLSNNEKALKEGILFSIESCSDVVEIHYVLRQLISVPVSLYSSEIQIFFNIRDQYSNISQVVLLVDAIIENINAYKD